MPTGCVFDEAHGVEGFAFLVSGALLAQLIAILPHVVNVPMVTPSSSRQRSSCKQARSAGWLLAWLDSSVGWLLVG